MKKRSGGVLFLTCFLLMTGCGTDADRAATKSFLNGSVVMGPVSGASCTVKQLNADGTLGDSLGSGSTGTDGSFSIPITAVGAISVTCIGGSYSDEATGGIVPVGSNVLQTLVSDSSSQSYIGVNALTTIAAANASANASNGLAIAIAAANKAVGESFGLSLASGSDISSVKPADLTLQAVASIPTDADKVGLAIATFSQIIRDSTGDETGGSALVALACVQANILNKTIGSASPGCGTDLGIGDAVKTAFVNVLAKTPVQALSGLKTAQDNFTNGPRYNNPKPAGDPSAPKKPPRGPNNPS